MSPKPITQNTLFYGDNLPVLRDYIPTESIDLIYLDPPFNSNRSYNVLFREESGKGSEAQITAFDDSWHWGEAAEKAYHDLMIANPGKVDDVITSMRQVIGTNQMMAYLVMMAARLVELHRVLKPTGSLYLHCDPTASHYLKIILDTIFDFQNFRSEIVWKRSSAHGGAVSYNDIHDSILFYSKGDKLTWNSPRVPYDPEYINSHYSNIDVDGRRYQLISAHGAGDGPSRKFGDREIPPPPGRHWMSQDHIDMMMAENKVVFTKSGMPRYKRFLEETDGTPLGTVWDDIPPINSQAAERLGYPTQKPLALLERIILASSNPGDIILDPFCGCGTAIAAAEKLGRQWVGIDITHLAISLIKYRMKDMFPACQFAILGEPTSLSAAHQLAQDDRYQFQWWALSLIRARPVGGQPASKTGKKGSDQGIDGVINFIDDNSSTPKRVIVQVKSGHVKSGDIRDLRGAVDREKAAIGVFVTLENPTPEMTKEAASSGYYTSEFWQKEYPKIQILTIEDLLKGTEVKMPPDFGTFKQAPKEKKGKAKQPKFDI